MLQTWASKNLSLPGREKRNHTPGRPSVSEQAKKTRQKKTSH